MFEIGRHDDDTLFLRGRFDASRTEQVTEILDSLTQSTVLDFTDLRYISSTGLGLLIAAQSRLGETEQKLRIINASAHIKDLFQLTRFDSIIDIE